MRDFEPDQRTRLFAPAKVNLGLEVLRRRPDGYHAVATVLESISIFDVIDLSPSGTLSVQSKLPIPTDNDLSMRALRQIEEFAGVRLKLLVRVQKRIPVSAGLGGGSSDAGTLIGAIGRLLRIPEPDLLTIAGEIGSDVPFFVRGGVALATGTGTELTQLDATSRRWYVVAVPDLKIEQKTAHLYGQLTSGDFTDGQRTAGVADRIINGLPIDSDVLVSAFERPLMEFERYRTAVAAMKSAGAAFARPSGAGPAVFTICPTFENARSIQARLLGRGINSWVATSVGKSALT